MQLFIYLSSSAILDFLVFFKLTQFPEWNFFWKIILDFLVFFKLTTQFPEWKKKINITYISLGPVRFLNVFLNKLLIIPKAPFI